MKPSFAFEDPSVPLVRAQAVGRAPRDHRAPVDTTRPTQVILAELTNLGADTAKDAKTRLAGITGRDDRAFRAGEDLGEECDKLNDFPAVVKTPQEASWSA